MNQLEMMSLFVLVAELGSFADTAKEKGIARSVVTRQIAALEEHLSVQLIARSTRKQALTNAGKKYLKHCKVILDMVSQAEAELKQEQHMPKGNIRISLPLSYGLRHLTDLLMSYAEKYPDISLDLDYSDRMVDVNTEGFDLAIRLATELAMSDIVRKLDQCELILCAAPSYLKKHGMPTRVEELQLHRCLQYSHHSRWHLQDREKHTTFNVIGNIKANNGDALAKAAVAGMGISLMPDFIAEDYLRSSQLVPITTIKAKEPLGIYAVLPTNNYMPERIRLLLEYLSKKLQSN